MSFDKIAFASNWWRKGASAQLQAVGFHLADICSCEGACYPSIRTLAKRTNLSDRQVQRLLAEAEERGLLRRVKRTLGDNRQTSNGYEFIPVLSAEFESQARRGGDAHVTPPGDTSVTPPVTPMSPKPGSTESNSSSLRRRSTPRRLPPDWTPGEKASRWITTFGLTVEQAQPAIEEFKSYWAERSQKRADWDAAFMRNSKAESTLLKLKGGGHNGQRAGYADKLRAIAAAGGSGGGPVHAAAGEVRDEVGARGRRD